MRRMSASTGKAPQTITLKKGTGAQQFWIAGATLVGPNEENGGTVGYWHYPRAVTRARRSAASRNRSVPP
jgi:hypothetical protein